MATNQPLPWLEIRAEYLRGVKPKALAEKYGCTSQQIRDKACSEQWRLQRATIANNIESTIEQQLEAVHATVVKVGQQILGKIAKGEPLTADEKIIAITVTGKAWAESKAKERKVNRDNCTAMTEDDIHNELDSLLNG